MPGIFLTIKTEDGGVLAFLFAPGLAGALRMPLIIGLSRGTRRSITRDGDMRTTKLGLR